MEIIKIKKGKPYLFSDVNKWGGKGDNLLKLSEVFDVPSGFVVSSDTFSDFVKQNGLVDFLQSSVNGDDPERAYHIINEKFDSSNFNDDSISRLKVEFDKIKPPLAVRSSSIGEDGDKNSYAGQYETILGITRFDDFLDSMKKVYASLFNAGAIAYEKSRGLENPSIALVVQTMVNPKASGVAYSPSPNNKDEILVESTWGLCTSVVDGRSCDIYRVLDTVTENIISDISPKKREQDKFSPLERRVVTSEVPLFNQSKPSLTKEQILEVAKTVKSIERSYGCPMDVEFAFDNDSKLYVLQARPITSIQYSEENIVLPNISIQKILAKSRNIRNQGIFEGPAVIVRGVDHVNKRFDIDGDLEKMNKEYADSGYILITPEVPPQLEQYVTNAKAMYATECGTTGHAAAVACERGIVYLGRGQNSIPNLLQNLRSGVNIGIAVDKREGILYLV